MSRVQFIKIAFWKTVGDTEVRKDVTIHYHSEDGSWTFSGDGVQGVTTTKERVREQLLGLVAATGDGGELVVVHVDGDVICADCRQPYRAHAYDTSERNQEGRPYLRIGCDGRRLKL